MISLLFAGYLVGMTALAAPVILHLIRRRPKELVAFPSFMFLEAFKHPSQDRRNLRRWLLLLVRCLLLTLLALAFAWPYFAKRGDIAQRATVLLIDHSYSMLAQPYREELRRRAESVIRDTGPGEPAMLGFVADQTSWSGDFTEDAAALEAIFHRAQTPVGTSQFEKALRHADALLSAYPAAKRRIVVVTDSQLTPWRDVRLNHPLSAGVALEIIAPAKPGFRNVGLAPPAIRGFLTRPQQTLLLDVPVRNFSDQKLGVKLVVRVDGKTMAEREVSLAPFEFASPRFELKDLTLQAHGGQVELIVDDQLALDNWAYFAVNPTKPPRVGLVGSHSELGRFVALALDPTQSGRDVVVVDLDADRAAEPARNTAPPGALDLIVLCQGPRSESTQNAVNRHLGERGTAVAIWGDAALRRWLGQYEIVAGKDTASGDRKLDTIDFHHPIFDIFLTGRVGSLFGVLFLDPPAVTLPRQAQILARFDNGWPAIAELNASAGKLIVIAHPLSRDQTTWPAHATFLPFWRQVLTYATTAVTPGASASLTVQSTPVFLDGIVRIHGPKSETFEQVVNGRITVNTPGIYQAIDRNNQPRWYAANVPLMEGDPILVNSSFDTARLVSTDKVQERLAAAMLTPPGGGGGGDTENDNRSYWWELMVIASVLLVAELYLANRTSLD